MILFENFYLKGIVKLGSNAFQATGTNTVVLFLQKREKTPSEFADGYRAVKWILGIITILIVILATIVNIISKESLSFIIYTDMITVIYVICVYYLSKFIVWILEKGGIL